MTDWKQASRVYRTFVRGTLVQESGLCVGGSAVRPGDPDIQCALDGQGRLTIPGTGLAGALIETAGRICPDLFRGKLFDREKAWRYITGKTERPPSDEEARYFLQSAVRFFPCHLSERQPTEIRQGVGIRQATGATAAEQRALFDLQAVPAGAKWDLLIEIDTLRAGPRVEGLMLLALLEWAAGRCWLGAAAARGTGWMKLEDLEAIRLPLGREAIDAWPSNEFQTREELWGKLHEVSDRQARGADGVRRWAEEAWGENPRDGGFCYLTLEATFAAGRDKDGYGWDALSVGGHAAGMLEPLSDNLLAPWQMNSKAYQEAYEPDHPVVTASGPAGCRPFLPGSGVRGPLRHAASRWHRGPHVGLEVVDPNEPGHPDESKDDVSRLFGLTGHSARLLVRDAQLAESQSGDQPSFRLVWLQHHAEDEFAGGVWGHSKFDRTAVLEGRFNVRLVIEAQSRGELARHVKTLLPVLRMAELGYVPLGGGKWRGHGWLPWRFTKAELARAGEAAAKQLQVDDSVTRALVREFRIELQQIEENR